MDFFFNPVLSFIQGRVKPIEIGRGVSMDLSQIILVSIIVLIFNII